MDVTSLLNQSAGSNSRRQVSRESTPPSTVGGRSPPTSTTLPTPSPERTPPQRPNDAAHIRGRTPWNAGGYALPLLIESKYRSTSAASYRSASEQFEPDVAYNITPATSMHSRNGSIDSDMASSRDAGFFTRPQPLRSVTADPGHRPLERTEKRAGSWDERRYDHDDFEPPRHKFSDSSSSLSSFGSWASKCHSRISSVTTVNGGHAFGPSLAEQPIPESKTDEHDEDAQRHTARLSHGPLSATPRHRLPGHRECDEMERPGSPSDAVLNMKAPPRLHHSGKSPSSQALNRASHLLSSPKLHKRAISAPDFAHASSYLPRHPQRQAYSVLPPLHRAVAMSTACSTMARGPLSGGPPARDGHEAREAGMAREHHVLEKVNGLGLVSAGLVSQSASLGKDDEGAAAAARPETVTDEPRCMFVANCDTGSQLRKAISHLFGRNKSCTLKIPKEVWVYYCRKHYQRIRYRNARTYPSNQMELVKVQIVRLQSWSETNKAKGKGPYIKQWTLSLRKREQNRLDSGKGNGDEGDDEPVASQGGGSAVPEWIIQLLGDGYTTDKMLDIAERLHQDIAGGSLSLVPEIEFLPDIVDDEDGGASKPARARRQNSGAKTPKRKAGDFGLARPHSIGGGGDLLSVRHGGEGEQLVVDMMSPPGKRARTERASNGGGGPYYASLDGPAGGGGGGGVARAAHGFMMPVFGGEGRVGATGLPPRAPNVVPKMRPMEYGHGFAGGEYGGEPRFGSFSSSEAGFYGGGGGGVAAYGPNGIIGFGAGHGGVDAHTPLPSISPRMGHQQQQQQQQQHHHHHHHHHQMQGGGYAAGYAAARPTHQRSASAYTPASRHVAASATRPSSSGGGAEAAAAYGLGAHAAGGAWAATAYGHGPAHEAKQAAATNGRPPHGEADGSPRSAAATAALPCAGEAAASG